MLLIKLLLQPFDIRLGVREPIRIQPAIQTYVFVLIMYGSRPVMILTYFPQFGPGRGEYANQVRGCYSSVYGVVATCRLSLVAQDSFHGWL